MESLKNLVERKYKAMINRHPEWSNMKFVNHGLGLLRIEEHAELIKIGAIACNGDQDIILCDYPILVIHKNEDTIHLDLGGNLMILQAEMENKKKNGIKCNIQYFPKTYQNYYENKEH